MRSVPQPRPDRLLLFDPRFFPIANTTRKNGPEALPLGVSEPHRIVSRINRLQLTLQNIIRDRTASDHTRRWKCRVELVTLPAGEVLRLNDAVPVGAKAGVDEVGGFGTDDLFHCGSR